MSDGVVAMFSSPNYAELEKDPEYIDGLTKLAVSLALKGHNLDFIKQSTNYSGSKDDLLHLIDSALVNELELYKTIYRTRTIISLNNDMQKIDEVLENCRQALVPSLMGTKLKINQEMTKLLNEMTGLTKPGLNINYTIEGVDLSEV